jgi:hypothetical protein
MLDPSTLVFVTGQAGQRLNDALGAGPMLAPSRRRSGMEGIVERRLSLV